VIAKNDRGIKPLSFLCIMLLLAFKTEFAGICVDHNENVSFFAVVI
jgi:hypothetical protein